MTAVDDAISAMKRIHSEAKSFAADIENKSADTAASRKRVSTLSFAVAALESTAKDHAGVLVNQGPRLAMLETSALSVQHRGGRPYRTFEDKLDSVSCELSTLALNCARSGVSTDAKLPDADDIRTAQHAATLMRRHAASCPPTHLQLELLGPTVDSRTPCHPRPCSDTIPIANGFQGNILGLLHRLPGTDSAALTVLADVSFPDTDRALLIAPLWPCCTSVVEWLCRDDRHPVLSWRGARVLQRLPETRLWPFGGAASDDCTVLYDGRGTQVRRNVRAVQARPPPCCRYLPNPFTRPLWTFRTQRAVLHPCDAWNDRHPVPRMVPIVLPSG